MWSGETFKFSIFNFQIWCVTPNLLFEIENLNFESFTGP